MKERENDRYCFFKETLAVHNNLKLLWKQRKTFFLLKIYQYLLRIFLLVLLLHKETKTIMKKMELRFAKQSRTVNKYMKKIM